MTAIFGNGMIGKALARMIGGDVSFMDNKSNNVSEVINDNPDCVVLGVLDDERQHQMRQQLSSLGYNKTIVTYEKMFDIRLATMRLLAASLPEGDVAELGVYKGDFAFEISRAFPDRQLHLYDSFEGFDGLFTDTSEEYVHSRIPDAKIHYGYFPGTFEKHDYAFLSLDVDLYEPTRDALELFYPCMVRKGIILIHDYNSSQFPGVKKAVDEFCKYHDIPLIPVADLHGSVILIKQ